MVSDLDCVVRRLSAYYAAEEIAAWLFARHAQLDGERAIDLINAGRSVDVLRIVERLEAGVFL